MTSSLKIWQMVIVNSVLHPIKFYMLIILMFIMIRIFSADLIYCDMYDPTLRKPMTITISSKGLEYGKHILNESYLVFKHNPNITTSKALELLFDMLNSNIHKKEWFGDIRLIDDIGHLIMLRNVQAMNDNSSESQLILLVQIVFHVFIELDMDKSLFLQKLHTINYIKILHAEYFEWTLQCKQEYKVGFLNVIYAYTDLLYIYLFRYPFIRNKTYKVRPWQHKLFIYCGEYILMNRSARSKIANLQSKQFLIL